MSHIVKITTEVRDAAAVRVGCHRLRLPPPIHGTHRLFNGEATGLGVQLPDWKYIVVCDLPSGELKFDNFNGRWGEQKQLDRFLQGYAVEKAKLEARKKGHSVTEQQLADGSIKVVVQIGSAA